eukprot:2293964-Rhodomonas_salina.4
MGVLQIAALNLSVVQPAISFRCLSLFLRSRLACAVSFKCFNHVQRAEDPVANPLGDRLCSLAVKTGASHTQRTPHTSLPPPWPASPVGPSLAPTISLVQQIR